MEASTDRSSPVLDLDDFVRRVMSRGTTLHWLCGAGVSVSAGVPTAWDMIGEFKGVLYAQAKRIPLSELNADDPHVQERIDAYFAGRDEFPQDGDPEEYAFYFERVHTDAASRQRKIEQMLAANDPAPSMGHVLLALMWQLNLLHVAWTTNFDDVLEQAASVVSGAPRWLRRVDRSEPEAVKAVFESKSSPVLVKLHGDFQSERLDNTVDELEADSELRTALAEAMRTKGLVVVGYSGRDASIMAALEAALHADHAFSAGLYWVIRAGDGPLPAVRELIAKARERGVDAYLVRAPSFEELMAEIRILLPTSEVHSAILNRFQPRSRLSDFEIPGRGGRWPRLRLNAVAVADYPKSCRLVQCEIGGTREVKDALANADVSAIAARRRDGVLAFGDDGDLLRTFGHGDPKLDYATLDAARPADVGILYDAVLAALSRSRPLVPAGRRRLAVDPGRSDDPGLAPLVRAVHGLTGRIPGTHGTWAECVELRLEHRHGSLWLIYAPSVWSDRAEDEVENEQRREWTRERQVKRYNRPYTALLKAWADVLCDSQKESRISALGLGSGGTDATFVLKRLAPYAERGTR